MTLPPGPPPFKGIITQLRLFSSLQGNTINYFRPLFAQYGDFITLQIGEQSVLLVSNPDAIYEILVTKNAQFYKGSMYRNRKAGLARFLGNGLLTSDGEFWKRQRKLVAPALHARRIEAYAETMVQVTRDMIDGWRGRGELDVDREMMHATLQIVARSLFNADVKHQTQRVGDAMTVLQHFMTGVTLLPAWIPTPGRVRTKRAI